MANVILEKVCKTFDGKIHAVKDFSLEIKDGEFLVLVGPSGCGKSTTLRMVAGLEEISSGTVKIGDRIVNDIAPKDRDIAMVFQNYALYPHMTVYDNMAFGLKLRRFKRAEIERRVKEAARILGLEEYLARRPKALSGGQRQRVAMGRAIVREPAVFLFDEPLSNLDAKMRVEMRKEILHLHRRIETTMIYVTHDQVEAMTLGDRICVMRDGVIEQVGEPTSVFNNPATLFVARFIGSPPMNLFAGMLVERGKDLVFETDRFQVVLPTSKRTKTVEAQVGKKSQLGLRPRGFVLKEEADDSIKGTSIRADVDVSEMLGEELLVHMTLGEDKFILSTDPRRRAELQGSIEVCLKLELAHIFDDATGKALTVL
jgi:multiple sugar transport system ATP-binding protein